MCLIVEHAHLLKENKELSAEIERFRAQYEPELPSGYNTFDVAWFNIVNELKELGIECMLKVKHVPDALIRFTDEEGWRAIVPFLTFPGEYYVEGVSDCDDYARWATADSSKKFKINGCLECWGKIPEPHAFNLVRIAPGEYRLFEPNAAFAWAGELFEFGAHNYFSEYWRL